LSTGKVPVLVLKEGSSGNKGKEAQRSNIIAAKVVGKTVINRFGTQRNG
jgi:hypothetical protein